MKTRVFSKEKYINSVGISEYNSLVIAERSVNKNWVDLCNGKEVIDNGDKNMGQVIYTCQTSDGIFKIVEEWTELKDDGKMIIDNNSNLNRLDNGDYEYIGDLVHDDDIVINLDDRLIVIGKIKTKKSIRTNVTLIAYDHIEAGGSIEAGRSIKAGSYIEADDFIEAGGSINVDWGIRAGLSITAKWLSAGYKIFAGICTWKNVDIDDMQINVEEIKCGEIAYGKLNLIKFN